MADGGNAACKSVRGFLRPPAPRFLWRLFCSSVPPDPACGKAAEGAEAPLEPALGKEAVGAVEEDAAAEEEAAGSLGGGGGGGCTRTGLPDSRLTRYSARSESLTPFSLHGKTQLGFGQYRNPGIIQVGHWEH